MLRDNPDARRRFQRRFHHLLVDEFQDTDPIQAEIAFFLAGDPDDRAGSMSKDWEAIVPTPGKLFMVGDPKQSIYRFRRADIVTMAHVRHHLVHESTPLQQNFRSQQSIISWVNHVFGRWMRNEDGSELQAEYRDLVATHGVSKEGEDAPPPAVYYVGESVSGKSDFARRLEGQAVAALARRVKEERWQVRNEEPGVLRDATYRDICLLLPSRTNLEALEQALEAADVPYRIESESIVLGTEDVRQLLNCLRAIDSPGRPGGARGSAPLNSLLLQRCGAAAVRRRRGAVRLPAPRQRHGPGGRGPGRAARIQQEVWAEASGRAD